jgi:membrane protease YdiL (CAAX protease family)
MLKGNLLMLRQHANAWHAHRVMLYCMAFGVFVALLTLRESAEYGHMYNFLPVMGRTTPFVILTILMATIYKLSGHHFKDIGLVWPRWHFSRRRTVVLIVMAAVLILTGRIASTIPSGFILELLNTPPRLSRPTDILEGNLPLLLSLLPIMWLAVISEEVLIRGLLMNAIANVFGQTRKGWVLAIVISAIAFGVGHFSHGLRGIIGSGIGGLVYGLGYYLVGRNLLPVIVAHAAVNTIAFVGAYFGE